MLSGYQARDLTTLTIFVAASALIALIFQAVRRVRNYKERADSASRQNSASTLRRTLLLDLGVRAVAGGSLEAICHDAVTMMLTGLEVEYCAIFNLSRDAADLTVVSAAGWDAGAVEGLSIAADIDTLSVHSQRSLGSWTPDGQIRAQVCGILPGGIPTRTRYP